MDGMLLSYAPVFTWYLSSECSVLSDVHPPSVLLLNSGETSASVCQSQELLSHPSFKVGLCL